MVLKLSGMGNWKSFLLPGLCVLLFAGWLIGRHFYFQPKYELGAMVLDFPISEADNELTLKDLRGSYVLIYFWGSWCAPCREANPALEKVYEKYQQANFENGYNFNIVGIAIEKDPDNWRAVLRQDRLRWRYHVLDLTDDLNHFDAPVSQLYGIKKLPSSFLLDGDGRVIALNLAPKDLDQFLKSKLKF